MASVIALLDAGTRVRLDTGRHQWYADEPLNNGGTETGPSAFEMLLGSLAACTAITLRLYARHKGIVIGSVRLEYQHYKAGVPSEPIASITTEDTTPSHVSD